MNSLGKTPYLTNLHVRSELAFLAGQDSGQLDTLVSGGVYALVPQSPPARYPLWAGLLRQASQGERTCHVLLRTTGQDFLERIANAGWPQAHDVWRSERLRLYHMNQAFSTHIFRMDIEGLTAEFAYWSLRKDELLLVDAADELLSLHDLSLATSQLAKLRNWAKSQSLPVLLNFNHGAGGEGVSSLYRLMDNLSGLARLHNDPEGPKLTLEYWQGALGIAAERSLALRTYPSGYTIRQTAPALPNDGGAPNSTRSSAVKVPSDLNQGYMTHGLAIVQDEVWARELQMLTNHPWTSVTKISAMLELCSGRDAPLLVLRCDANTVLADLAAQVHQLRSELGPQSRIVIAEHRVSLRYANEMMLLRLGANAIIRQDVSLDRWPAALDSLIGQPAHAAHDLDVKTAMANAATPHGRGYLAVPDFLSQLHEAQERSRVLDLPFALAVLKVADGDVSQAIQAARFRRSGDFVTTDGSRLLVFFNSCSLTRGQQVLDSTFDGRAEDLFSTVDWMSSEGDVNGLINILKTSHLQAPFLMQPMSSNQEIIDKPAAFEVEANTARQSTMTPDDTSLDKSGSPTDISTVLRRLAQPSQAGDTERNS